MSSQKILILNQPFDNNTGGGITLSNLFANSKKEDLAVACSGYLLTSETDASRCDNYYQLGSKERQWVFPFNLVARTYYSGPVELDKSSKENIVVIKSKLRVKLIINYLIPILDYFGFSHFFTKSKLSQEFCNWVTEFNPKVVYAQATTREELLFCIAFKKRFNIPMVFHMMDDWPTMVGIKGFCRTYWENKINNEFRQLFSLTEVALSISDYMAEAYKVRYGKEFLTFHNSINIDFWRKKQRKKYQLSDSPRILYAGRVGLGIDESLKNIAMAIKHINDELGSDVKFSLQVKERPDWAADFSCVVHNHFVEYEELPHVFAAADLLILPYDFSIESISFIKYSMPTKAPEYMASGTPIIIFAPEDTAIVKYAKRFNWAKVVQENSIDELVSVLKELLNDELERKEIAQNAVRIAEKNHDSESVAAQFDEVLNSAISKLV